MSRLLLLLAITCCLLSTAFGISVDVPPHGKECFYEDLNIGDKMTVSYQVGEGGNLDIDFWIYDQQGRTIKSSAREASGTHIIQAVSPGRYTFCFGNQMSSVTAKSISFNVHDMEKVNESAKEHIDPIAREIRELADTIQSVKSEQEYIVVRERKHRDTAESTNARVKWWSLGQVGLLIAVCLWQVTYLKRFFEVKRVV
ncbi:supernatant protein factor C-terminal domain-containing protein [Phycomyces nitens]|nr:supernatant protein factor C-terminal domain-containing protein [Phycomyces nitens]